METHGIKILAAMEPRERRATAVVTTVATLRLFALFALLPVMAIYAGGLQGATPTLIGLAVGGYGLTQALLQIPLGALSDRIGRVPVTLGGLAVFAAGSVLAAMGDSIHTVIAGRLLQGAGAISATLTALLADATRVEVRTRTMALFGLGIGSTFLLALGLGPAIAAIAGTRSLFWLGAVLAGIAALALYLLPAGIAQPAGESRMPVRKALTPPLLRLDVYIFVLHALLAASFVALPFLLQNEIRLPLADHWKVYTTALVVSLAGTVPLVLADERRGKDATVTVAVALLLSGQLVLAFGGIAALPVVGGLALFFAGFNFLEAGLPARLSIVAPDELRGASLGVFSSAQFLGIFAGGLVGGRLLEGARPSDVFLACSVLCCAWIVAERLSRRPRESVS